MKQHRQARAAAARLLTGLRQQRAELRRQLAAEQSAARQARRAATQRERTLSARIARQQAELDANRQRREWLEAALTEQRQARQVLEATLSANYAETIAQVRRIVRANVPREATMLVISKGDPELLKLDTRQAWHFPRAADGEYAGHYPAESAAAIADLQSLIAQGAEFLLLPNTAFWWLKHYDGFERWLEEVHSPIWRDERCVIYKLAEAADCGDRNVAAPEGFRVRQPSATFGRPIPFRKRQRAAALQDAGAAKGKPAGFMVAPRLQNQHAGSHAPTLGGATSLSPSPVACGDKDVAAPPDLVCFPIINWDYRFQRPQQLMSRFASAGHRVFYLSHQFRNSGEPYVLRRLAKNLHEVSLRGSGFHLRHGMMDDRSREALLDCLDALRRDAPLGATVAIVQSPFWWPLARQAAAAFAWPVVYDCMDHHAGFPTSHPLMLDQERELMSRADLVVASSPALEAAARQHNRHVLLVRNGCDYRHFAKVPAKPRGARPVIGYFGAIAEWFDSDLVADLAERRHDWDFILVGSTVGADTRRLGRLPNVSLPGEKPYAEIPDWLARFDVTILPFKRTLLTEAVNPVKVYETFASGRPLVSVPLPEMVPLAPLARIASTAEEFQREIEMELSRPDAVLASRRRAFARANTWQKRFETLAPAICELVAGTAPGSRRARNRSGSVSTRPPVKRAWKKPRRQPS